MITALALGGGAARGLAHVGVLKVLQREGIPIDLIVGTSMGALVGGLYAAGGDSLKVENDLDAFFRSSAFRRTKLAVLRQRRDEGDGEAAFFVNLANFIRRGWVITSALRKPSLIGSDEILGEFEALIPSTDLAALRIRFASVALDIRKGEPVILDRGSLREAVIASVAIPGVFPPVQRDGRLLVDGDWVDPVPVQTARRLGADFIIAVDVSNMLEDTEGMDRSFNVLFRAYAVAHHRLKQELLRTADVLIRPSVSELHWADFSRAPWCIAEGEKAAREMLPNLRRRMKWRGWWTRWMPVEYRYPLEWRSRPETALPPGGPMSAGSTKP